MAAKVSSPLFVHGAIEFLVGSRPEVGQANSTVSSTGPPHEVRVLLKVVVFLLCSAARLVRGAFGARHSQTSVPQGPTGPALRGSSRQGGAT